MLIDEGSNLDLFLTNNCIGNWDGMGRALKLGWGGLILTVSQMQRLPVAPHDDPSSNLELHPPAPATAMEHTTTQHTAAAGEQESPPTALALRSLADYTVGAIPTLFYVPDFISHSEQSQLLHHVLHASNRQISSPFIRFCFFLSRSHCILTRRRWLLRRRFTRHRRPSGKPSRTGGYKTGVLFVFFALGGFGLEIALASSFPWHGVGLSRRSGAWEGAPAAGLWVCS